MTNIQTYDYAFIGLGAANSLLIKNLHQNNLLKGKSILIFEPDEKNLNDKSFCYWANPKENNTLGISDLSKVCWNEIKVNQAPSEKLNNLKYFYINSLDLYNQTKSILSYYSVKLVAKVVNHLDTTRDGEIVIKNGVDNYYPKFVFDSRPPKWHDLKSNESFLWQSFIGWRIELDSELEYSEPKTFTMMDFGVEQNNS
ncbi:MAG: lycopene cyclase family protein, partial [Bacteroidia bacterium]